MVLQTYQNFTEMTSNMIYIVLFGVGLKCPRKTHLYTQCPPPLKMVTSYVDAPYLTFVFRKNNSSGLGVHYLLTLEMLLKTFYCTLCFKKWHYKLSTFAAVKFFLFFTLIEMYKFRTGKNNGCPKLHLSKWF